MVSGGEDKIPETTSWRLIAQDSVVLLEFSSELHFPLNCCNYVSHAQ